MGHPRIGLVLATLILGTVAAWADDAKPGAALLAAPIDPHDQVTLAGNTRPEANAANDRGALADDFRLEHVQLLLKRSPAQEAAADSYIDGLTIHGSPTFHHWLSAAEFGRRFGVADADIAKIGDWLKANGLTVNAVYPSHMTIDFSGTAGQIGRAFDISIHHLEVNGQPHIANMSDPRIPAALAPAIEGIVSLNNFRPHNMIRHHRESTGGNCGGVPCTDLGPGDLATVYGLNALFNAGYHGEGETIATVEPTDLYAVSDWKNFRTVFGLNAKGAGKLVIEHPAPDGGHACADPGVNGDDSEATLDVEWASAAAPAATIILASCADSQTTDGLTLAIENEVNAASPPDIISVSYGDCEVDNGAAGNAQYNSLYQQAAAEGISVFTATGDSGPTTCTPQGQGTATGIGINGLAVSKYDIAVGGTDFSDTYSNTEAKYWKANSGAPWSTAKSYIPEIPWNGSCGSTLLALYYNNSSVTYGKTGFCNSTQGEGFQSLDGGAGGPSACYSGAATIPHVVSGSCKPYPKPSWQSLYGMPNDKVRDVPDVAMFASNGVWNHALDTCFTDPNNGGGPCTGNPVFWQANAGGTSYATPIMAGIQALVNEYTGNVAMGNPAPVYYQLARQEYGKTGSAACNSNKGNTIGAGCTFHDIVSGDNDQDCTGTHNCYRPSGKYGVLSTSDTEYAPAFHAHAGYDFTSGIGSVNASNLAVNWPTN